MYMCLSEDFQYLQYDPWNYGNAGIFLSGLLSGKNCRYKSNKE